MCLWAQQTWSRFSLTSVPDNNRQSGLSPTTVPEMSTGGVFVCNQEAYVDKIAGVVDRLLILLKTYWFMNFSYWYSYYPCPSAVSLQYICSASAVSTSCALDRPAVHKGYHLKSMLGHVRKIKLQEKYYVLRAEVSFEVQWSRFWSAAKCVLRCTGIALQTDMGKLWSRNVPKCFVF